MGLSSSFLACATMGRLLKPQLTHLVIFIKKSIGMVVNRLKAREEGGWGGDSGPFWQDV